MSQRTPRAARFAAVVLLLWARPALAGSSAKVTLDIEPVSTVSGPGPGVSPQVGDAVLQPLALGDLSLTALVPQAPLLSPAAPANAAPKPAALLLDSTPAPPTKGGFSLLGSLRDFYQDLVDPRASADSLFRLYSGKRAAEGSLEGGLGVPAASQGRFEELGHVRRRLRKGSNPNAELIPFIDILWERGIIGEKETEFWSADLAAAALGRTSREDVFKILAPRVPMDRWPLDRSWSPELFQWVLARGKLSENNRYIMAGKPAMPPTILRSWFRGGASIRRPLARNPATPPDILRELARDEELQRELAANPSTPADVLEAWAHDANLMADLASNPAVPWKVVSKAAYSSNARRRRFAAQSVVATDDILGLLERDGDLEVRMAVARHPNSDGEMLRRMAWRAHDRVADAIAGNPSTPADVLRELASEPLSRDRAILFARNRSAPVDILRALWTRKDAYIDFDLAANTSTPGNILAEFALRRPSERVRVALNSAAPAALLKSLLSDDSLEVRAAAADNLAAHRAAFDDFELRRLVETVDEASRARDAVALSKVGVREARTPPATAGSVSGGVRALFGRNDFSSLLSQRDAPPPAAFGNIVIDVRGSRGGNGDVAAGWLVATDILERLPRPRSPPAEPVRITFIMDAKSQAILSRMTGTTVVPGGEMRDGRIRFHTLQSLPASFPVADLYLSLASPSGKLQHRENLPQGAWERLRDIFRGSWRAKKTIPVGRRTVLVTQTVLGNTENGDSSNPNGLIQVGLSSMGLLPAGLADAESGVYSDAEAWKLRGLSQDEVRRLVLERLADSGARDAGGERDAAMLRDILEGKALAGGVPGLVYGISSSRVSGQFESYLQGLADGIDAEGKSYVLVTPSSFEVERVKDESLRARLTVLTSETPLEAAAQPGRIYIVKTKTLPHPVFVGLMAYSRIPPIVSGDGAMSAAIALGRPFVLTRVFWNTQNIANLKQKLLSVASDEDERVVLETVYGNLDLSRARELALYERKFAGLAAAVPGITDSLLAAARAAADVDDLSVPLERVVSGVPDSLLRMDLVVQRAARGDRRAREALRGELLGGGASRNAVLAAVKRLPDGLLTRGPRAVNRIAQAFARSLSIVFGGSPASADPV